MKCENLDVWKKVVDVEKPIGFNWINDLKEITKMLNGSSKYRMSKVNDK